MNNKLKTSLILVFVILLVIAVLFAAVEFVRTLNYKQIDDVHPSIECSKNYIEKSDVLMVIPLFNNDSIANHPEWCKQILSYNKTIGMHGISHTYNEFMGNISKDKFEAALGEFKKCFGKSPEIFEPPQWIISSNNRKLVEEYVPVTNRFQGILHKVYHCEESGSFAYSFWGIRVTNERISNS